jgi:hypothetical protein
MSEPVSSASSVAASLRAGGLGAAVAALLSALVRFEDELSALQTLAVGVLLTAAALLAWSTKRGAPLQLSAPPLPGLRAAAACVVGAATLWLLAPWAGAGPGMATDFTRAASAAERAWLCRSSLLATPYVLPRARVLLAASAMDASLLHACAQARATTGVVEVAPARPLARGAASLRALARARSLGRYDLVLLAVQRPRHALALGVLPFAAAPLESSEGLRDLFTLLTPDGVVAATMLGQPAALRWIQTARAALAAAGVADGQRHFVVYAAAGAYTVLVRGTPFETDALLAMHQAWRAPGVDAPASLQRWPAWLRTRPALEATPGAAFDTRVAEELRATDAALQARAYAFDIRATSDDRPLFFESTRRDRFDTWTAGTSYWVIAWSCGLATALAALLAWLAARRAASEVPGAARCALLITGYCGLAVGHALAFTFAQQRLGTWLARPLVAPALCVLALGGAAALLFALRSSAGPARRGPALLLSLPAPALMIALAATAAAPTPESVAKWGNALNWIALSAACGLGAALALGALQWLRRTPLALRAPSAIAYVAMLAAGVLLGPGLVLMSGYRSCALAAAIALTLSAAATLTPPTERT